MAAAATSAFRAGFRPAVLRPAFNMAFKTAPALQGGLLQRAIHTGAPSTAIDGLRASSELGPIRRFAVAAHSAWKASAEPTQIRGELVYENPEPVEGATYFHGSHEKSIGDQVSRGQFDQRAEDLYVGDEKVAAHFARLRNVRDLNNLDEHEGLRIYEVASKAIPRVNEAFSTFFIPAGNKVQIRKAWKLSPDYLRHIADRNRRLMKPRIKNAFAAGMAAL